VVSEPQTVSQVLGSDQEPARRAALLKGLLRAYGRTHNQQEHSLVVKFTSWNLLHIAEIRKLWPEVPCVIVVRHPLEVAVSCLAQPPGWMHPNRADAGKRAVVNFGIGNAGIYTLEARCAQILGAFFQVAAAAQHDEPCRVVDYEDLDIHAVVSVGELFNIPISIRKNGDALATALSVYSKDPSGSRSFQSDSKQKHASASQLLRREVENRAEPYYLELRNGSFVGK
jgi:hypothetical protein